jgi:putative heme-binding domain-containing protein
MAANSKIPAVRVLALNALAGARALTETLTVQLMGDSDWRVRRAAVKFIEGFAQNGVISDRLWARLRVSAADPYYQVRLQAALSSGAVNSPGKAELLRGTLARDPSSAWMQTAVLSAAPMQAANVMAALAGEPRIPAAVSRPLAGRLAEMAGVSGVLSEAQEVIALVVNNRFAPEFSLNVIGALGEGLHRTRSSLRLLDSQGRLTALFALALRVAAERGASDELRLAGIRVLGTGAYTMSDGGMVLLTLLNPSEPSVVQAAALRSLSFYTAPEVTPGILGKWRSLSPAIRAEALSTLLARTDQVPIALTLIENGNIPAEDALPWHKDLLRTWSEPAISQRASKIFGALETDRAVIVEKFRPTLKLSGAPNRGLAVFEASCSECHSVRGVWETPGPDLAGAKTLGRDSIYESLAAPSRRIASGRLTVVVTTLTGETLVGTVGRETEDTITIREAGRAAAVWPRLNIGSIQPQRWSLMPEGLERTIGPQGMADVIQFLLGAR